MADRRQTLRGLPVAALAVALPAIPAVAATPAGNPTLLRLAARVKRLATIEQRFCLRVVDIEDGITYPPHPEQPPSGFKGGGWSDDGRTFTATYDRDPHGERDPRWMAYDAALVEHEAECERLRWQSGMNAASTRQDMMRDRMEAAAIALTAMPATSVAELGAKADAWIHIDKGGSRDGWTEALAASVMTDAVRLGGRANA